MNPLKVGDSISLYNEKGLWQIVQIYVTPDHLFRHYLVKRGNRNFWIMDTQISKGGGRI